MNYTRNTPCCIFALFAIIIIINYRTHTHTHNHNTATAIRNT